MFDYSTRYYATHADKIKAAQNKRYATDATFRAEVKAKAMVARAISKGVLPPLGKCLVCPRSAEHYHHFSYEKQHWLHVIPLCVSCHRLVHHGHVFVEVETKIKILQVAPEIIVPTRWDATPRKTKEDTTAYRRQWGQNTRKRIIAENTAKYSANDPNFIEISPGVYYEIATGYPWSTRTSGSVYGKAKSRINTASQGYLLIGINGKTFRWSRLVWEFFNGAKVPVDKVVDHIDNDRGNNLVSNLQILSFKENASKCLPRRDNTSGYLGVHWHARDKKFTTYINMNGVKKHLGYFDDAEKAYQVFLAAKIQYSGAASVVPLKVRRK